MMILVQIVRSFKDLFCDLLYISLPRNNRFPHTRSSYFKTNEIEIVFPPSPSSLLNFTMKICVLLHICLFNIYEHGTHKTAVFCGLFSLHLTNEKCDVSFFARKINYYRESQVNKTVWEVL